MPKSDGKGDVKCHDHEHDDGKPSMKESPGGEQASQLLIPYQPVLVSTERADQWENTDRRGSQIRRSQDGTPQPPVVTTTLAVTTEHRKETSQDTAGVTNFF